MALSSSGHREKVNAGAQVGVLSLPKGINLLAVKSAGVLRMAVLPYTVPQGAKHPVAKPGEQHYARDYFVHKNFGPSGKEQAICPRLTFGKPCPICEAIQTQLQSGQISKDQAKNLNAKQRTLFNIWTPEDNKVSVFDASYHTFTKHLYNIVGANVATPGFEYADYFADAVEGSTIHATFVEKPLSTGPYRELVAALFTKHGGIPADILAKAVPLDNLLVVESYEALKAKFWDLDSEESDGPAEADHVPVVVTSAPVTSAGLVVNKPISVPVVTPAPIQTTPVPSVTAQVIPAAPAPTEPPAVAEPPAQQTKKRTTTPKAAAAADDAPYAWVQKGKTVYSRIHGECTVLKNQDGVITLLDSADEPHKAKLDELAAKPWPEALQGTAPAKTDKSEVQAASSEEGDESWDWEDPSE